MRYVIHVKDGEDWLPYVDRWGELKEYDDPATAHSWVTGAESLPASPEFRIVDTELPQSIEEAVVVLLSENGPLADFEMYEAFQKKRDVWGKLCDATEQHLRTRRSKLVKMGRVERMEDRRKTATGKTAAVWRLADG